MFMKCDMYPILSVFFLYLQVENIQFLRKLQQNSEKWEYFPKTNKVVYNSASTLDLLAAT